jgi:hypothetical protein
MLPMGTLADRKGERYPIVIGCLAIGAATALFVYGRGIVAYAFACAAWPSGSFPRAPAVGGLLLKRYDPTLPFLVSGAICVLAALPAYIVYRLPRPVPPVSKAPSIP